MATTKKPGSGTMGAPSLYERNRYALAAKTKARRVDNPGPGPVETVKRGLQLNKDNKTRAQSDALVSAYGSKAPNSRGFMAYEKPTAKAKPKPAFKTPNRATVAKKGK